MSRLRLPRWWGALALGVVALVGAGLFVWGGDGAADDGDGDAASTSTTMATGDLEIEPPDGWYAVPLPTLGFGLALPQGWESVVLSGEGLSRLAEASPVVPGFVDAAHNAAASGAVLYAAGVDDADLVTDLKVRAAADSGVTDATTLEDYARALADEAELPDPAVTRVEGAAWPTVDVRYHAPAADDGEHATEGTERSVLAPGGVVYSLLVTSETGDDAEVDAGAAAAHDRLAAEIFATLVLADAD
jgi:hypothetical protein